MSYQNLRIEKRDGIAVVTVNRPEKLNALDDRTMEELDGAFTALRSDPAVGGVILTGAGEKAFVAGADISELATPRSRSGSGAATRARKGSRAWWARDVPSRSCGPASPSTPRKPTGSASST